MLLSRLEWVNLELVLLSGSENPIAEGVPLGDEVVEVDILISFVHSEVHPTQRCFSL